ncbi:MAG TPA: hypothetical protein VM187_14415, partial [Niastella sp.]|nr:hypothetical protein [Niastella sp.]
FIKGRALDSNAPIYYTEYKDDNNPATDEHNIMRYINDVLPRAELLNPAPAGAVPYTVAKQNFIQWAEMNSWKGRAVSPEEMYEPRPEGTVTPVPAPIPEPPTPPPPTTNATIQFYNISFGSKGETIIEINWSDNYKTVVHPAAGDRIVNIYIVESKSRASVSFAVAAPRPVDRWHR